jgi:peroxiredoxin
MKEVRVMTGRHDRSAALVVLVVMAIGLALGCGLLGAGCGSGSGSTATTAKTAPDFSGTTLDGVEVSLSGYLGKPVVLVFTASWCPSCGEEAPEIDQFYRDQAGRVGVLAMDVNDSVADMQAFMSDGGYTYPVMLSADDAAGAYGVRVIPTLFVIDAEGRIAKKIIGGASAAELSSLIDDLTR